MKQFEEMGRFLKSKRVEAGLTQLELADKLKLSSQMVSNWERGLCAPPSSSLKKLTALLNVEKEDMLSIFLSSKELLLRMSLGMSTRKSILKRVRA